MLTDVCSTSLHLLQWCATGQPLEDLGKVDFGATDTLLTVSVSHPGNCAPQAKRLDELEKLYKDEVVMRKRYFNMMEDMKGKIRVYCRVRAPCCILLRGRSTWHVALPATAECRHIAFNGAFEDILIVRQLWQLGRVPQH
jgi:hypothetical protein